MTAEHTNTMARSLGVTVQIGKKGLTAETLKEIEKQLKKRRIIKIKFLASALGLKTRAELADTIVLFSKATPISSTGNILVLRK